jgi:hypothetical protein
MPAAGGLPWPPAANHLYSNTHAGAAGVSVAEVCTEVPEVDPPEAQSAVNSAGM